jgi:hypothetical protein
MTLAEELQRHKDTKPKNTTHSSTWKKFEGVLANFFGGKRTPLSGMSANITKSDIIHPTIFVECKFRARFVPFENMLIWQDELKRELKHLQKKDATLTWKTPVYRLKDYSLYWGDIWIFYNEEMPEVCKAASEVVSEDGKTRMVILNRLVTIRELKNQTGIINLYADTERKSLLEEKVPVVALKMKNKKGWLFVINPKYLQNIQNLIYDTKD